MPLATWPVGLPDVPIRDSFRRSNARPLLTTEVEDGPPIRRLASQTRIKRMQYVLRFTRAQKSTFETFYETTLNKGADDFTMSVPLVHSGSFVTRRCYIEGSPEETEIGELVDVNFVLCVYVAPLL